MDWNSAFDITLKEFKVSAKWLSERTGISQQSISKFRQGHSPMTTDNLNALLAEIPFEARQRFFSLILGSSLSPVQIPLEKQIENLPKESRKQLVMAIVESLVYEPKPAELPSAV